MAVYCPRVSKGSGDGMNGRDWHALWPLPHPEGCHHTQCAILMHLENRSGCNAFIRLLGSTQGQHEHVGGNGGANK